MDVDLFGGDRDRIATICDRFVLPWGEEWVVVIVWVSARLSERFVQNSRPDLEGFRSRLCCNGPNCLTFPP